MTNLDDLVEAMEFAGDLEDEEIRGRLRDALDRCRPFRSFKDALLGFPAVRQSWFEQEAERKRQMARDWLESIRIPPSEYAGAENDRPGAGGP